MQRHNMWYWYLVALAAVITQPVLAGLGDVCALDAINMALIGDRLYFMGGNLSIIEAGDVGSQQRPNLYWLDINADFPVQGEIPAAQLMSEAVPSYEQGALASFQTQQYTPSQYGALWSTNDTLYPYYGAGYPTNELSTYDTSTNTWDNVNVAGGDYNFGNHTASVWTSVPSLSLGFFLGGVYGWNGAEGYDGPSMLRFDASDQMHPSWTNESLGHGSFGAQVPLLGDATMIYVPAGKEGMLIVFGGYNVSRGWNKDIDYWEPSDMSQIAVYDISSHHWWWQTATGTIPDPRAITCAAVSITEDASAFHITMYGGVVISHSFEDVFVLTLPSFTWINATSVSARTDQQSKWLNETYASIPETPYLAQRCTMYENSEIIVLGGKYWGGTPYPFAGVNSSTCPTDAVAVRVLDTSNYVWRTSFDINPTYSVPPVIVDVIGGE